MPYILSCSVSPGSVVQHEFDPPLGLTIRAKMDYGDPLSPEEKAEWVAPRMLRACKRSRKPGPPAIMGWSIGPFLVCEAIKQKLESLEPGNCRFMPFETWGLEDRYRDRYYGMYYWVFPPSLDAVVIEETHFAKGIGREGYERSGGHLSMSPDAICVLNKQVIGNHHLWRLPPSFGVTNVHATSTSWRTYFCSNALRDYIKAEQFDGWSFDKKCVDQTV